jgi:hypothetical protein
MEPDALFWLALALTPGLASCLFARSLNGRAIGVLGTGVDVCYPKENKNRDERY